MTPERWKKLEALFHEAIELPGEARAAHLAKACGDDEQLRQEAERLLAAHERESSFIDSPIFEQTAELTDGERQESLVGQRLGPYQVASQLGRGGMGEVYLAEDSRLHRKVALKVLPAAFTQHPDRVRRFEREARAASALNHPNILTIYEIGQADGLHFIATEFVDGVTLRQQIQSGRMSLAETLSVAVQVASALSAAHEAGIVHRDIKPENVMLRPDGLVKVLDFGLAKLTERPAATPDAEVDSQAPTAAQLSTEPGVVMGTVNYMSPEQARGLKVDARTDIFSLGVTMYELVAGRRPFEGKTASDVLAAILQREPEPVSRLRADAPPELERIISRMLAKEREARYRSAAELRAEFERLQRKVEDEAVGTEETPAVMAVEEMKRERPAVMTDREQTKRRSFTRRSWQVTLIGLVALMLGAIIYVKFFRLSPAPPPSEIKSLAVLPLENLSGDPQQEYFADGMTEAIIGYLAKIRALRVVSRPSVMRFKGSRKSLPEIAQELNVDAVIVGSVQRASGRVKISAQLIHAASDAHLWSDEYERELSDVLRLQSEVARVVADKIRVQVTAEERTRLASARSVNPQAQEAYLLGRYHLWRLNEEDLKLAIGYFERAIRLDGGYAAAWAGLSKAWGERGIWGTQPFREVEGPARNAAMKAITLDASSAEAHASLASIKASRDWDWTGAEQHYRRALELDPGSAEAHQMFAVLLMALGRHTEAISEIGSAEQVDPLSSNIQSTFGRILYRARRYDEAIPRLKRAIDLDPRNYGAYRRLGDAYEQTGRYTEAISSLEKSEALRSGGGSRGYKARLARVYARMGRRDEAQRLLKDLQRTTQPAGFPKIAAAAAWAALDDKDEAFRLLFSAVEERSDLINFIKEDPPFDNLHSDPRWKELLRRMNFPEEQHGR